MSGGRAQRRRRRLTEEIRNLRLIVDRAKESDNAN